jgi:hypothetical protein
MERKAGSVEVQVTAEEVRDALPKAKLSPEEEKVLRMRYGVGVADPAEPLPSAARPGTPLADELSLIEAELHRARKQKRRNNIAAASKLDPTAQKTREKIVRALRRKK